MLRKAKDIIGYSVYGAEGEIGKVDDLYFDEDYWVIRYLRVDMDSWFSSRKALLSVEALGEKDWNARRFGVSLTRDALRNSPEVDFGRPVSRKKEEEINTFFQWPVYWDINRYPEYPGVSEPGYPEIRKPGYFGAARGYYSPSSEEQHRREAGTEAVGGIGFNIRSVKDTIGGPIQATDGEIGHLENLIIDDDTWAIRYLSVDTRTFLPGKHVLLLPHMILRVDWAESRVFITVRKDVVKLGPEYDPSRMPDRAFEDEVYEYYVQHSV